MNRKQKKELRQRQSTRQLMGIVRVTPHGIVTDSEERVFFLIQPDNLSVLSSEVIRGRVRSLTMLLSTQPSLEILALDSRESFQRNKEYYLRRLEEETEPAVRELVRSRHGPSGRQFNSPPPPPANLCWCSHWMKKPVRMKARCGSWRKPYATTGSACVWRRSRM